jgi:hypothetical protein
MKAHKLAMRAGHIVADAPLGAVDLVLVLTMANACNFVKEEMNRGSATAPGFSACSRRELCRPAEWPIAVNSERAVQRLRAASLGTTRVQRQPRRRQGDAQAGERQRPDTFQYVYTIHA